LSSRNQTTDTPDSTQSGVQTFQMRRRASGDSFSNAYTAASAKPPNEPTAAASVGVANPNTIVPSTARMSTASGKNDARSILKICRWAKVNVT
jgi:hypothetical protein